MLKESGGSICKSATFGIPFHCKIWCSSVVLTSFEEPEMVDGALKYFVGVDVNVAVIRSSSACVIHVPFPQWQLNIKRLQSSVLNI